MDCGDSLNYLYRENESNKYRLKNQILVWYFMTIRKFNRTLSSFLTNRFRQIGNITIRYLTQTIPFFYSSVTPKLFHENRLAAKCFFAFILFSRGIFRVLITISQPTIATVIFSLMKIKTKWFRDGGST